MTKKNRIGAVAGILLLGIIPVIASTAYAKSAPMAGENESSHPFTQVDTEIAPMTKASVRGRVKFVVEWKCKNKLANWLYDAGFRGRNIREAWAISMRESHGTNLGPGDYQFNGEDYGLFQFNSPTFSGEKWWDDQKLVNPLYNAGVAFRMSKGGDDWSMWGLDGNGNTQARVYVAAGWSQWQIDNWITIPYQHYYNQYPCK
jgi:hypothetical protein